ncbi:MAG TPA: VCBS repeat-containing protein, partial [Pirellulales bacterium]|nr:VCBS repeat-containing protein [Pirellulales bacterium]
LVDFDSDGDQDLLTCAGDGSVVVFRRQRDGEFATGETLKKPDGLPIIGVRNGSACAADWDEDGDIDLILPGGRREIRLLRNRQNGQQSAFGEPEPFNVDGEPILARYGNPAPLVADWDGDGRLDVLMGNSDGSVVWYRNAGAADDTVLEEGRVDCLGNRPRRTDRLNTIARN